MRLHDMLALLITRGRRVPGPSGLAVLLSVLVISMLAPVESAAQNRPEIMGSFPPEVTGYIRMGGIFHENFFQLPNDGPRRDVVAGVLELRIEERLGRQGGYRAYTRADLFQFQGLGTSPGVLGGLRRVQGAHQFDLSITAQWNRPRFDGGDDLEQANVLGGSGSYRLRVVSPLELIALAEYRRDSLKLNRHQDSESHDLGAAVQYRAFRRRVSAEAGFTQGGRRTSDPGQEYVQETAYVVVRTSAIPRTYLSVRYRHRVRGYTTEDATSRNFEREDQRQQVTAYMDIALWGNLVWNLSGGFEQAESTRTGTGFRARQLGSMISVMLPGP
jgi:hypothetical protein